MTPLLILTRPVPESDPQPGGAIPEGPVPEGLDVWCWPLLTTRVAALTAELEHQLRVAQSADVLIHVSVAGVRALAELAPHLGRDPRMTVAAVGPATAAAAQAHLHRAVLAPSPAHAHSEGLLQVLDAGCGTRVALVIAPGGRELLASTLQARGAQVWPLEVYRREPCIATAADLERLRAVSARAWISVTSVALLQALQAVLQRTGLDPAHLRLVCSAPRIAEAARAAGFIQIHMAESAAVAALGAAVHTQPQGAAPRRC